MALQPRGVLIVLTVGVLMGDLTLKEWSVAIVAAALAGVVVLAWS